MFKNHPRGLPVLFFTEMWERFGFYLMLGIFTLYMTKESGLGMSKERSADIYGTYIALVYLTPFIGGLLADRVLGYRRAITIGGLLMGTGYCLLAVENMTAFYTALGLIIVGNGFFKPNISTLVGNLYADERYKAGKDAGFNIFYMGINIGAFVCNFVAAYLRVNYGWGWAFAAAGVGMYLGLIWFWVGQRHVKHADVLKPATKEDMPLRRVLGVVFVPALVFGAVGWFVPDLVLGGPLVGSRTTDAFLLACIPVVAFYVSLWTRSTEKEKGPVAALLAIMGVVVIFWAIFHQNGSALTFWAEEYTDRSMPAALEPVAGKLAMVERVPDRTADPPQRLAADGHVETVALDGSVERSESVHPYLKSLPRAEWPDEAKGESLSLIPTELYQSINPFFVVILTPAIVGFFALLRRRKKEPTTPGKIGWGLFITAISTLIMVAAVFSGNNGETKTSGGWLFGTYLMITLGELCLSPMGLSLVSKLSPPRITALMMGGWFLATAIGNKLSGVVSGLWNYFDHKSGVFLVNAGGALLAAAAIFVMLPWMRRVMKEHERDR